MADALANHDRHALKRRAADLSPKKYLGLMFPDGPPGVASGVERTTA
jgi:hypothetical protein